jgi:hypothetical protein
MKKPSLRDSLTPKLSAESPAKDRALRLTDTRMATSVRIEPDKLERLKVIAFRRRVRVNELILEGVDHVLALYGEQAA